MIAGFAPLQAAAQQRRDLTVAVQDLPPILEPGINVSNVGWRIYANMFDTLVGYDFDHDFAPVPRLAASWKRIDAHTLEVQLRTDAKFSDGSPVTAEDVAFTFGPERMTGDKAPTRLIVAPYVGTITGTQVVDTHTLRFITAQPDPLLVIRLATPPAAIISRHAYLAAPDFQSWQLHPMGSGPYRLGRMRSGEDIVLDAMDDYWGGRPNAKSVRFWLVPEVAARVAAVRSRAADIATDIPPDQEADVHGAPDLDFVGGMIANHRVLSYDTNNPVLRDPRVRQALSLAIDREAIARDLWGGRVTVPRSHQFPAYRDMYIADWPKPAYDPDRARALLREAGYKGEPIEYRYVAYNYYANEVATAQVLAEMWKAVGLNIRLVAVEGGSQTVAETPGRGIRNWSTTMSLPDPVGGLSRSYGADSPVQGSFHEWHNDEFNRLGKVLATSLDGKERLAAWRRMLEIYDHDDPPGTVLHQYALFYIKRHDVDWKPIPVEWMDLRADHLSFR